MFKSLTQYSKTPLLHFLLLTGSFEDSCRSHPSSNAHRHKAVSNIPALHFIEQHRGQLGSGATQRVAYRNRPSVDIHNVKIQPQMPDDIKGL